MKKLFSAVVLLLASVCAFGQGATVLFPPLTGPNGVSVPFAKITFCTTPATFDSLGNCTNTVTVYQNITLTTPYSSAILTDGLGNFPPNQVTTTALFFTATANLCYTATGGGISVAVFTCTPFSVGNSGNNPAFTTLTAQSLNGDLWVGSAAGQYSSIAACYAALVAGQACNIPANWTDPTWTVNLALTKNNAGLIFHGAANIPMSTFQVTCSGTIAPFIKALPAFSNRVSGTGQAVVFHNTGTSDVFAIGVAGTSCQWVDFQNFEIDSGSGANTVALHIIQSNNGSYTNVSGGGSGNGAVGLLLDGNSACACDNNFYNTNFGAGASGSAIRLKAAANLNHFYGGSVTATAATSIGIDIQSSSGNTFDIDDESNITGVSMTGTSTGNRIRGDLEANTTGYTLGASTSNNIIENTLLQNLPGTDSGTNNRIVSTLLGQVFQIGGASAQTGTGADLQFTGFSYTLAANTLTSGKCVRVKMDWFHGTGTTNTTYKIKFGSTAVVNVTSSGADNGSDESLYADVCNNAGVQNAQAVTGYICVRTAVIANISGCTAIKATNGTSALDFTQAQTITGTFNVANTDQAQGARFSVELP